jgi:GTP cyclohydrolase IA
MLLLPTQYKPKKNIMKEIINLFQDEIEDEKDKKKCGATKLTTPITSQSLSDEEKISIIQHHFKKIIETLGLDINDPSIKKTPLRIAKMYVKEIFSGLNSDNFPDICLFDDFSVSPTMSTITIKDISIDSFCEHHFVPMTGKAYISYIPNKKIIGLSKINRIVNHFAKRPQLQERLTSQICECISQVLHTQNVAVFTKICHQCVRSRGIKDRESITESYYLKGKFHDDSTIAQTFFSQVLSS